MCDYFLVSRHRRAITISSSVRRRPSSRSVGASCAFAAVQCRRYLTRLVAVCAEADRREDSIVHRQAWIDVAGHRILLYESVADDKSTANAIATRLWRCSLGTAAWLAEQAPGFDGQSVLEVGAGTGLCSLTLAAVSTAHVISSDLDETAVQLVRTAARQQALRLEGVIVLDMSRPEPLPQACG